MVPLVGLNLSPEPSFVQTIKPLIADGLVDALEWDVDSFWVAPRAEIPAWLEPLLDAYASDGRLYAHCVWLSMLTARRQEREDVWLERLAGEFERRPYRHVSEHLGVVSAGPYFATTTLPLPRFAAAASVGRERIARLSAAAGVPVGLENMVAALGLADAVTQPALLEDILAPSDGFVLLDLHNLYTQAVNLGLDPMALLASFPCDRVREVHVSGGSWRDIGGRPFRFDSHDDSVPSEVFELLAAALSLCPHMEVVMFERRPGTITSPADVEAVRADYVRVVEIVQASEEAGPQHAPHAKPLPEMRWELSDAMASADQLADYHDALIEVLARKSTARAQHAELLAHPATAPVRDYVASFELRSIAATSLLARRWSRTASQVASEGLVPNEI